MSDLFHEKVAFSYIERLFDVIKQAHRRTLQILPESTVTSRTGCGCSQCGKQAAEVVTFHCRFQNTASFVEVGWNRRVR